MRLTLALSLSLALSLAPQRAEAFCGFYVSGADQSLYANATMVVMMRDGNRTILSMQNDYSGPPEDFAMIVPVPQVLQKENVKTLPRSIFKRVDDLAAPRLVEYWETDPCYVEPPYDQEFDDGVVMSAEPEPSEMGVVVEAQFEVGEYQIVVLSAADSGGLDSWLKKQKYNIPDGAEAVLRPYVESGTKFFVAKVNPEKVTFANGRAVLSPLRFHYDADDFSLPVRLGLLSSQGEQDLLVHILARGQRYQVANYENAFIPTNIRVHDGVRDDFGRFYDALFEKASSQAPRTVVTEYSWDASTCDPCPTTPLQDQEILTLGGDVLPGSPTYGFTLTRMHYRYDKDGLDHDLVFEAAPPVVGGRGTPNSQGELTERGAQPGRVNNFQGRYVILHPWQTAAACPSPVRGRWGGPPTGGARGPKSAPSRLEAGSAPKKAASVELDALIAEDVASIGLTAKRPAEPVPPLAAAEPVPPLAADEADASDTGCHVSAAGGLGLLPLVLALGLRRRERSGRS